MLATAALPLVDSLGRVASDLRVSLTDRCNLRCTYCMPAEGMSWIPAPEVLTDDEMIRLIQLAATRLGITKVRFTGGEPLLRKGLEELVSQTASVFTALGQSPDIALTTNGIGLARRAGALAASGLTRVNISLDSLDPQRYAQLARRDRLSDVLAGLEAAEAAGLRPIKINSVIMRGVNESDIVPLTRFCLQHGYELRFIEQMPLGPKHGWDRSRLVSQSEILEHLARDFVLRPSVAPRGSAPAEIWQVAAGTDHPSGRVGVIASVTAPFCGSCDRTRLTADGQMRNCLFSDTEVDLRRLLRTGASDDEIANAWRGGQYKKLSGHGINQAGFEPPVRNMSAIGG